MKTISGLLKGEPKAQKFLGEGPWGTFLLWSRPSDRMASEWTMVHSVYEDFGTEVLLFPIFLRGCKLFLSVPLIFQFFLGLVYVSLSHSFPSFSTQIGKMSMQGEME